MSTLGKARLIPVGGGDAIPLIRPLLTVEPRESCDVCMRFPNVSGLHCELSLRDGYWYIRDLNSTNGIKVNGTHVQEKAIVPGDEITIGKRKFTIEYTPPAGKRAPDDELDNLVGQSLLEKAGLVNPHRARPVARAPVNPHDLASRAPDDDEDD